VTMRSAISTRGSDQIEEPLEGDTSITCDTSKRGRAKTDGVVIRECDLSAVRVLVDTVRAALPDQAESGTLQRADHTARWNVCHVTLATSAERLQGDAQRAERGQTPRAPSNAF
jgi:hypothetical protein